MATTTPPPKKRCWGKSNREKINIIENMELEILDEVDCSSTSDLSAQANHMTISDNNDANIDLQHPELLTNAQMVDLFTERRVPVPVYEDGSYSRERLLFLFRKHILPKPQRKKLRSRNQRYKDEIYHKKDGSETMEWTNTVQDIIREDVSRGLGDGENRKDDGILGKRYYSVSV